MSCSVLCTVQKNAFCSKTNVRRNKTTEKQKLHLQAHLPYIGFAHLVNTGNLPFSLRLSRSAIKTFERVALFIIAHFQPLSYWTFVSVHANKTQQSRNCTSRWQGPG